MDSSRPSFLATLFPGYFSLVMATGIVSIDAHFFEFRGLAMALFYLNIAAYLVLWTLTAARLVRYPANCAADLQNPMRSVGFLTMVAGTCILGNQFAMLTSWLGVAAALWLFGALLWIGLIYAFFTFATIREPKSSLDQGINGAWLLVVVSTQSVSVLATLIARSTPHPGHTMFIALAMFLLGLVLYLFLFVMVLYRWLFFDMRADVMTPPYWINMGALAITTLAGSRLLLAAGVWEPLTQLAVVIKTLTFAAWVTASWWIPLLIIIGFWRHAVRKVAIVYDPAYWALVFPLGMYAACTLMFAKATAWPLPVIIPQAFFAAALVAWSLAFFGLLRSMLAQR